VEGAAAALREPATLRAVTDLSAGLWLQSTQPMPTSERAVTSGHCGVSPPPAHGASAALSLGRGAVSALRALSWAAAEAEEGNPSCHVAHQDVAGTLWRAEAQLGLMLLHTGTCHSQPPG
jgi:hypothetical protein